MATSPVEAEPSFGAFRTPTKPRRPVWGSNFDLRNLPRTAEPPEIAAGGLSDFFYTC
jgi:hypothetical protein